ncbi:hypothetical protein P4T62_28655 [Bacillus mycoides]|uniref:hypothetical protein n=1 Tax=Bacillus mycoides TaxID=1405 RepID=UPI002E23E714|nr:hypothetical protein [Bacillus mycoides]
MEEKQEKNKIVEFGNKIGENASEFGNKVSETAKQTFDHLNVLKYFTKIDKEISKNEKEKAIKIIEAIDNIKDDKTKADVLNNFINSDHRKEIIGKIIHALKYLGGTAAIVVVTALLNKYNDSSTQERDCQ